MQSYWVATFDQKELSGHRAGKGFACKQMCATKLANGVSACLKWGAYKLLQPISCALYLIHVPQSLKDRSMSTTISEWE